MNFLLGAAPPNTPQPRFLQAFISSVVVNLSLLAGRINGWKKLMTKTIEFTFIIKMMDFNLMTIVFQKNRTKSNSLKYLIFI